MGEARKLRGLESDLLGLRDIGIDEDPQGTIALPAHSLKQAGSGSGLGAELQGGSVKKTGMVIEQATESRHRVNDVLLRPPVETGAFMDDDFFSGQPLHTAGEAESPLRAGEGAELVAKQRPGFSLGGEPRVVMGFTVVNQGAHPWALVNAVLKVGLHGRRLVFLKKF